MVDGGRTAGDLLNTAKSFGGGPEILAALLKDGFIGAASADGKPAAAAPATEADREKLYAAKAAMRRYIKMASVDIRTLGKAVDDIKSPADLAAALRQVKTAFEANGFAEAFANLGKELSD